MSDYLLMVHQQPNPPPVSPAEQSHHLQAITAFHRQLAHAGVLRDAERLRPTSEGKRVRRRKGDVMVENGPFGDDALSAYCLIDAPNLEQAAGRAREYPLLPGETCEVRPLLSGDVRDAKGDQPGKVFAFAVLSRAENEKAWIDVMDRIDAQTGDQFPADRFVGGVRLDAPGTGRRLSSAAGRPFVTDGPFLESKEVIGGLFFMRLPGMEDAVRWAATTAFTQLGTLEIRELWRS